MAQTLAAVLPDTGLVQRWHSPRGMYFKGSAHSGKRQSHDASALGDAGTLRKQLFHQSPILSGVHMERGPEGSGSHDWAVLQPCHH